MVSILYSQLSKKFVLFLERNSSTLFNAKINYKHILQEELVKVIFMMKMRGNPNNLTANSKIP